MCALVVLYKIDHVAGCCNKLKKFLKDLDDSYVAGTNQMGVNKSVTRIWN